MTSRSKRWTWTLNNHNEQQKEALKNLLADGLITYIVWGEEIAPETGTPHLQGYMETAQKKTLKSLQKILVKAEIHLALFVAMGTQEQNKTYCLKSGGDFYEQGKPMEQGRRNDLEQIIQLVREGKTYQQIWELHPKTMIIHRKGVMEALAVLQTSYVERPLFDLRNFDEAMINDINTLFQDPKTLILWGDSGTGKTTIALNLLPKALVVSHIDDLKNLNLNHEGIIFDDMAFNHIPREAQIHLVDWDLPRSIHIRYGTAYIPAKTPKIFTTNQPFGLIFLNDRAINRRVKTYQVNKNFI